MSLSSTLRALDRTHKTLSIEAPHMLEALEAVMAEKTADITDPERACQALFSLPLCVLENALLSSTPFDTLLKTASAHFPLLETTPEHACHLSEDALCVLVQKGLPFHQILSVPKARLLWMTKSSYHGAPTWKKAHPRKHPVLSYWEDHGANLPNALGDDGVELAIDAIKNINTYRSTRKMWDTIHKTVPDWRVVFAMNITHKTSKLNRPYYINRAFGEDMAESVKRFFHPKTAHEHIAKAAMAQQQPNLNRLLATPCHQRPKTLDALLTLVYG